MNNNLDTTRFYVKDSEIVSVVERLLANIKKEISNIGGGSSPNYLPILQAIEQALNSPNTNIPITDIDTGDYNNAPIQTKQYQNTQYLKAILACIGQATNLNPDGMSIMSVLEFFGQYYGYSRLQSREVFVDSTSPFTYTLSTIIARTLIIHNRSSANIFLTDPHIQPSSKIDALQIMPNEKLTLEWIRFEQGQFELIADYGTQNRVGIHIIQP